MKRSEKLLRIQNEIDCCFEDLHFFKQQIKAEKKRLKKLQKKEVALQRID